MKRLILFLLLAIVGGRLFAQAPNSYYDGATGKTGTELRQALHDIIDDHTTISYGQIWNAFWTTDNKGNNVVWDMYSDGANYSYYYTNGDDQCGTFLQEGDCYNREHSWPKSWFSGGEDGVPGRDLHHIFPTDGYVNQERSNYPYGEVRSGSGITTYQNGSKLGSCKSSLGYTGTVFEPIDEYKGDFARAYFYMSTRYYGEDSDWGSSGMTDKSDLKDWAITMLLRWSDNDPVSDKEMDRNNAVYGIQGNRNPFIDHPEYAHIIWDPDWTGVTYNITCASVQHGNITAPSTAVEGTMVTLTATPAIGYMLDSWIVYKTGDPSTTVTVSSNGTFTMPSFNVTVSATFVQNNTYYAITKGSVSHGDFTMSANTALSGSTITLSASPATGYVLYDWYVYKTDDINTHVSVSKSGNTGSFTMPAFDVTVMASFAQGSGGGYEKVTSALTDWSGEYLIVCETQNVAFNGTVESNWGRCSSVTISNGIIESNTTTDGYKVTVSPSGSGYAFMFPDGKYMNWTTEKKFSEGTTAIAYTISLNNGAANISYGDCQLQYNHNGGSGGLRSYKSAQTAIQLYKKTSGSASTPTHTIHFFPNGGQGSMNDQTVNEFEPTALNANTFTRQGYAFDSWNTAANGSGTTYFDGATISLLSDLTLYAQWNPLFSVNCASVDHGSINASHSTAVEGTLVTLTATPDAGYDFDYWVVTANNELVEVEGNQFVMPASNVDVSAVFSYVGQTFTQKYYLVTDANQLVDGRTYLIVNTTNKKALGSQNAYDRASVGVQINNNTIAALGNACEVTLGVSGDYWTLFDPSYNNNAGGYLYAASSQSNQLMTQSNVDDNAKWNIEVNDSGVASIVAQGENTHRYLRYSKNSNLFSCYTSGSGSEVSLFIRSEECDFTESKTVASINTFDKNTIHAGVTLTVENVLGMTMCNNALQLVLEDGAQLVHGETGLNATMKKIITAWSDNGGWYTIAAPFASLTPSTNNGLIANDYDLYAYDEDSDLEWLNYKVHHFGLAAGEGYLYANSTSKSLRMAGELKPGNYSTTIDLSYANSEENLKGWNLLGNPTAHEISFTKSANVADGYYYLNNSENWEYETSNTVPVVRGFLVKANATGQSVTLNPQSKGYHEEKGQYLCLNIGEEKAYVKLNEGVSMLLMDLNGRHSGLYLMHDSKPYVMLVRNDAKALDLCFEARQEGTQTITVDTQGLDIDYLHLIDHKTGADVDLLATPSYAFEASEGDYATRFRLAFAPMDGPSTSLETFAYWADGEIRLIAEPQGAATLQVLDLTGRMVVCSDVARNVSTANLTPGVYVLRLVTDADVRVQKIVVK